MRKFVKIAPEAINEARKELYAKTFEFHWHTCTTCSVSWSHDKFQGGKEGAHCCPKCRDFQFQICPSNIALTQDIVIGVDLHELTTNTSG